MTALSSSPSGDDRLLGTLVVVLIRGRHLTNRVRIGKQNTYATVTYGLNKKRTATIERGGQQPNWDEEFRFEILKDEREQAGAAGAANALVNKHGGVLPVSQAGEQANKLQSAAAAQATPVASNGKKVLRLACYADDVKDPKLVGEGTLELDEIIKKGTFDDWVKLERKGKFAGELFLELTWYSSGPPPPQEDRPPPTQPAMSAYGGAGSRIEDFSDDDRTEEWDGSDLGPSPGAEQLDVAADYPDPDLAPLSQSMSTLSMNQRPLPTPPGSAYGRPPAPPHHQGYGPPPPQHQQNGSYGYQPHQQSQDVHRRASYAGGPGRSYGAPPMQGYSGGQANEFGGYDEGAHGVDQTTIGASTQGRPASGFQQLAQQHYAQQGYDTQGYDQQQPTYQHAPPPNFGQPPPPPQQFSQGPHPQSQYYDTSPTPPPQFAYSQAPPAAPYQQPLPVPPQPPATPSHWQNSQPAMRPHSSAGQYAPAHGSLRHSGSVSSFAPPPSLQHQQPDYNSYTPAPSHFSPPPTFSPPPAPPAPPSAAGFGNFPPPPPQPPLPPPGVNQRYSLGGGTPLPVPPPQPASTPYYGYGAPPQAPQPPLPPPALQQAPNQPYDHGYDQQQDYSSGYQHAPPPPPQQDYSYQQQPPQQNGYGSLPPAPPSHAQGYQGQQGQQYGGQQQDGAGHYNPYSGQPQGGGW